MEMGFSSIACPGWDLATIVRWAAEMGYNGFELRGLRGELHLPSSAELSSDPKQVSKMLAEHNVQLVCLASSVTLDSKNPGNLAQAKTLLLENIELASRLECPFVRIFAGDVQRRDHHRYALSRISAAIMTLQPLAARYGVTLLVENGGDLSGSEDLWHLLDAAEHPSIRCCWNQCNAAALGERPTNSIPRLGSKIRMVHLCDADFDGEGILTEYRPLGEGQTEICRQIELLKGMAYDGYLIFEWPKMWVESLSDPETALPQAADFLKKRIEAKQSVLSAYKSDKKKPMFTTRATSAPV